MPSWLDALNPAQREAVTAGDGPLLIVAGAGTGKTRTLACRVAYLVEKGVAPDRILLLTFTRRAAAEMLRRASQLIGATDGSATAKVWGGTFHAVANRLLRIYGQAIHLPADFTILDPGDAADLLNLIRNELGVPKKQRRFPRKATLLSIYSRMVNAQEPLSTTLEMHYPWCVQHADVIRAMFDRYVGRKKEQSLLDYDDLLLFWSALCVTPGVGTSVAGRFDHILVDEYQDTNPVQSEILRGMRKNSNNVCVVGDDAQAIYSFRAATVRNILDFPKQFPGARIVPLEQNYRSVQSVLKAANAVMAQAKERYTKELWSKRDGGERPVLFNCLDESEQADAVCDNVLGHLECGASLMDQAVLFRTGHHSAQLEIELRKRGIPFRKFGGLKFVEAAHIKDMLALLRILENPHDEVAWYRVLLLLEGVGPRTAHRIMDQLGVRRLTEPAGDQDEQHAVGSPLDRLFAHPPAVPPAANKDFAGLRDVLANCSGAPLAEGDGRPPAGPSGKRRGAKAMGSPSERKEPPLGVQLERIQQFYVPIFERTYDNPDVRLRDIEQLSHISAGYRSRSRLLVDLTLDPPESTGDLAGPPFLEEDYLTLSTIHSAKGCEWTVVHVIHAADGNIPSDMALADDAGLEEERRLLYVAMTRAKDMLYVYFPLRFYHRRFGHGDAHSFAQLSRFLTEDVCGLFERRAAGVHEEPAPLDDPGKAVDPYRRVSLLWEQ